MSVQSLTTENNFPINTLGKGAKVVGDATAIGENAFATGPNAVAIGKDALALPGELSLGVGAPIVEVNTSSQYIRVKIQGVLYKLLLA